ncbi:hypothetical protein PN36_09490 [Candidatus Thiomargarita nelsonii]|uniref:Serpin domain-containing protein n=1 Tax=Candidatus Thiomargarita nelsonii TaxID=1003181 RepID=A0A4E0QV16_9GAMM|nr:hypothetical protein PN36_09490 [Candidatus Thiomargarita nelsonii]
MKDNTAYGLIPTVVKGNTAFALDLYAQLCKENSGNLFFSPYSLSTALAMTYVGAAGETGKQMSQVLHFPQNQAEFHPAFLHLQDQVNEVNQKGEIELHIANALWGQKGYSLEADFKESLSNYYSAVLKQVDFKTETEKVRQDINLWVAIITLQKIKELVKAGILNHLTRLVLVNAIYFKANWASQFKRHDTKDAPFWVNQKLPVNVPTMNQKHLFNYMANDKIQILELPYTAPDDTPLGNNSLSMIVLLPQQGDGLAELERSLNTQQLDKWLGRLRSQDVKVSLPKFKISTHFELSKVLTKMGMSTAFNEKADFSGIDGTQELFITSIVHQAFVDVNEEGNEAAAATAVVVGLRGMSPASPTFRADHPFIFLIRHNLSGSILFMGRIVDPSEK